MKVEKYRVLGELIETNKRQFIIPVYQRNYDWEKENCKKLFDDIVSAYEKDRLHFIGSIVYVDQGEENKIYRYLIIDGQQRITTIFLLLKALYDTSTNENIKKEIEDILFNIDKYNDLKLNDQTKIKLKPIKSDNAQFMLLMKNEIQSMLKTSNIYLNYDYLKNQIIKIDTKGITAKDILSGLKKLTSAVIILDPIEDDPQIVFESINSTGVSLSLADLIRNYILMTDKNQEQLFENYWLKIENNVSSKEMPHFLTDYLQFICKEKVSSQNAYALFKNTFIAKGYTNESMLQQLLHYSYYYKAFLYGDDNTYSIVINKRLKGLKILDQGTIYPFLFHVFDDYSNQIISTAEFEKVLTFFFNYLLRRIVCGVTSNTLRGLYKTLYNRIFVDKDNLLNYYDTIVQFFMQLNTKDSIPSDSALKDSLLNTDIYNKKNVCKYILKSIEDMTEDGKESKEIVDVTSLSIEHIMPQALNDEWKKMIGDDYEKVYEKYLHNIGNLSLTGYNSELGQKSFREKQNLIKAKNSHIIILNKDVLDKTVWNLKAINDRADRLSGLVLKLFPIEKPAKSIKFIDESKRRLSLAEDFDPTGTRPKSCIFFGINFIVDSYVEILTNILNALYDLDSDILDDLAKQNYKIKNAEKPYITKDPYLLRKSVEIKDTGIFFETNLSAKNIVNFLKSVLDAYDLEYEEVVISIDSSN